MRAALIAAREALQSARGFIANGVDLGFIRMPDADCPDPAHETPGKIAAAIALIDDALAEPQDAGPVAATVDIPIDAAKTVAQLYGYDQVVIVARKVGADGREHVTTYGIDKAHCDIAARMGNFFKYKLMKWPEPAEASSDAQALRKALELSVQAMRAPFDGWKGELERKALDAARAALRSKT